MAHSGRPRNRATSASQRSPDPHSAFDLSAGHYSAIVQSSDDAIITKSPDATILSWNPGAERIYGYTAEEAIGQPISILIPLHRAGEEKEILRRVLAGERVEHYETERVRKDGRLLAISVTVSPMRDPQGNIVGASVIARDVTERKRAEEQAARVQEVTSAFAETLTADDVVAVVTGQAVAAVEASAGALATVTDDGQALEVLGASGYDEELVAQWRRMPLTADVPMADAVRHRQPVWSMSREWLVEHYPVLGKGEPPPFASLAAVPLIVEGRAIGVLGFSFSQPHDFAPAERAFMLAIAQQAGQALQRGRLYEREREARLEVEHTQERLGFLARASEILGGTLELEPTLQQVADLAVPRVADWCSIELAQAGAAPRNVAVAHADPAKVELARELQRRYPPDPEAPTGAPNVIRTGEPELYSDIPDELLAASARDEEHLRVMRELGLSSAMVVPLTARERTLGALTLIAAESGRRYGDADLSFAQDLARRAAMAVDNALAYREEHRAAVTLQRSLLPDALPEVAGVELAARYLPAGEGLEVGGDWYDAMDLHRTGLALVIGDVAGRGVRAASVMGQVRNALRAYLFDRSSPGEAVLRVNRLMRTLGEPDMATLAVLVLEPRTGALEVVRAGHPPALVRAPDGAVSRLMGVGDPPIGVSSATVFRSSRARLEPGSTVLLYTDGLVERRGEGVEEGISRLEQALRDAPDDLDECCDHVLASLGVTGDGADDVALLAARYVPRGGGGVFRLRVPAEARSLVQVRHELENWIAGTGMHAQDVHNVVAACNEACANAAEHAYGPAETGTVEVEATMDERDLVVSVRDFGAWRPPSPAAAGRGRGLKVMHAFMDSVDVSRSDEGTVVRMVLRRSASEAA